MSAAPTTTAAKPTKPVTEKQKKKQVENNFPTLPFVEEKKTAK